jgi:hypothetical protein
MTEQQVTPEHQLRANRVARQNGWGRATEVILGTQDRILRTCDYGYRKNTTNEYVSAAYRANFGWKNTYYCHAECVVEISV